MGGADYIALMEHRAKQGGCDNCSEEFARRIPSTLRSLAKRMDPINNVEAFKDKRVLMISGSKDNLVPSVCVECLFTKLNEAFTRTI